MPHMWPAHFLTNKDIRIYLMQVAKSLNNEDTSQLLRQIVSPIDLTMTENMEFIACISQRLYKCTCDVVPLDVHSLIDIAWVVKSDCFSLDQSNDYSPPVL